MSVDDEIDVGRERRLPSWHGWSPARRRWAVAALLVLLAGAVTVWWVTREPSATGSIGAGPIPSAAGTPGAPGADVTVDLGEATSQCPAGATCRYGAELSTAVEAAFADAFGDTAGYVGRQVVADSVSGQVYWTAVRFTTSTLVTVTLSQRPVGLVPGPVVADAAPSRSELAGGSFTVTAVRDGYLMMAAAAGLPGQALPLRAAQQWVGAVPAP